MNIYYNTNLSRSYLAEERKFKLVFMLLAVIAIIAVILYIYFIYSSVKFSFAIEEGIKNLNLEETSYQDLEKKYFTAINNLSDKEVLINKGLVNVLNPQYISRTSNVAQR